MGEFGCGANLQRGYVPSATNFVVDRNQGLAETQMRGWAERIRTRRCHFDNLCCSSRGERFQIPQCSANQREFAQYFNGFPKMTFGSSSPLSPAKQYSLCSVPGLSYMRSRIWACAKARESSVSGQRRCGIGASDGEEGTTSTPFADVSPMHRDRGRRRRTRPSKSACWWR
jgi:hypothetical protein